MFGTAKTARRKAIIRKEACWITSFFADQLAPLLSQLDFPLSPARTLVLRPFFPKFGIPKGALLSPLFIRFRFLGRKGRLLPLANIPVNYFSHTG